jgi:hypothetical protein
MTHSFHCMCSLHLASNVCAVIHCNIGRKRRILISVSHFYCIGEEMAVQGTSVSLLCSIF